MKRGSNNEHEIAVYIVVLGCYRLPAAEQIFYLLLQQYTNDIILCNIMNRIRRSVTNTMVGPPTLAGTSSTNLLRARVRSISIIANSPSKVADDPVSEGTLLAAWSKL